MYEVPVSNPGRMCKLNRLPGASTGYGQPEIA
jgi:hypothetical protein